MSKKRKIRRKLTSTVPETRPEDKLLPTEKVKGKAENDRISTLIRFDKRTNVYLLSIFCIYILFSTLKFHTSSVGMWGKIFQTNDTTSIIAGSPRAIRQDEWMLVTPGLIGQYNAGMPVSSITMGDGNMPLLWGYPVKSYTMILKPNLWSYFFLDVERAFAFSWNFNIFFFLITTFLLLMLLTKNNFGLSIGGSFFIFLSGAMQWWSYSLGIEMIYLNISIISLIYLLYSQNKNAIILSGLGFLFGGYGFVTILYPAWQVPFGYLYFTLFIGFILKKKRFNIIKTNLKLRALVFTVSLLVLLIFLYSFYNLIDHTFQLMMNTVYPGKRISLGGDLIDGKLFSEFFGIYLSDKHWPQTWWNICETSSFIMFFPIIFYSIIANWFKTRKKDPVLIMLSAYIIIMLIWILIGLPAFLSKITFLSMSPVYRTLPVLGIANCLLLFYYLGSIADNIKMRFSWLEAILLAALIYLFIYITGNSIIKATNNFFTPNQVLIISLIFTVIYLLIRYSYNIYLKIALVIILILVNIGNIKVHPLTQGLSSITNNPLVQLTKPIQQQDPKARWAVFGNQMLTNLLKANDINVFNGVKGTPILSDMKVLDPSGRYDSVYNRYAHINLQTFINGKDSVNFRLNENAVVNDNYTISMDPCSPKLNQLGIKYFMFTYLPTEQEIRCMTPVKDTFGLYIFKKND